MSIEVGGAVYGYPDGHTAAGTFGSGGVSGEVRDGAVSSSGLFVLRCYDGRLLLWSFYGRFETDGTEMHAAIGSFLRTAGQDFPASISLSRQP